jgi:hypothetical protein
MEQVNFIRALVIDKVPMANEKDMPYHYFDPESWTRFPEDGEVKAVLTEQEVQTKVVPITQFHQGLGYDKRREFDPLYVPPVERTYIAYSEEVAKLLDVPINAIIREQRSQESRMWAAEARAERAENTVMDAEAKFAEVSNWDLLERIRFLFRPKGML